MKKDTETCDTQESTCSTEKSGKLTTVKTVYARAAVVLLALNFCLTGYVVYNMNQTTQAQIDGLTGAASTQEATKREASTQTGTQTLETSKPQGEATASPVTTREK